MFDEIIARVKECTSGNVGDRLHDITDESTIVKIQPQGYDGCVCSSRMDIICIAKTYESALIRFDAICEGLDALCDEDNDVLDITLESTVIKYDTVSGMVRILGILKCYTEVQGDGFN